MTKEKYYIVPAEVYESNFPDDFEKMLADGEVAVFETDKNITELALELND